MVRYDRLLGYMRVSARPSEISQGSCVALEEILNINPLTGLVLLHKVGWALGNEAADLHCHPLRRTVLIA